MQCSLEWGGVSSKKDVVVIGGILHHKAAILERYAFNVMMVDIFVFITNIRVELHSSLVTINTLFLVAVSELQFVKYATDIHSFVRRSLQTPTSFISIDHIF